MIVERNVVIPMRDGTKTRANVYRPDVDRPVPSVLVRTPYCKDLSLGQNPLLDPFRAADAGLSVVLQDVRGRYESDGELTMFEEADDGYDSVQWVAGQPWCDGNVGMSGSSYLGLVQWLAATRRPPALRTIVPINIGSPPYWRELCFVGGAFKLGYVLWLITQFFGPETARRRVLAGKTDQGEVFRVLDAADNIETLARWRPLATVPVFEQNRVADWYPQLLRSGGFEDGDTESLDSHYAAVQVPALNVSGWYDYFLGGTLQNFLRMQRQGGSELARRQQRLLLGPWDHLLNSRTGEYDFGFSASPLALDFTGYQLRHFSRYLKSGSTDGADDPPVRIFVMGENVWRDEESWPLARARAEKWYLRGPGDGGQKKGTLSLEKPAADELPDHYLYDPRNPAPTLGGPVGLPGLGQGINVGPYDQRALEARPDVLVYSSHVMERPLEVTGPLTAVVYAATSGRDTDWIVRLCDVHPGGASRILAEGVLRARHREGSRVPLLLEPGAVERYDVDLAATSNVFLPGHRIRVDITSSSFPYIEPNPNTGRTLGEDTIADLQPALQAVFHNAVRPSHIVLPVIPR
jgi:putative CocE/NonD family hydrolase